MKFPLRRHLVSLLLVVPFFFSSTGYTLGERGFIVESIGTGRNIETRKKLIEEVLGNDALYFGYSALSIILDSALIEPRGQMQGRKIKLSPHVQKDGEFLKLLIHEIGHYVDIYSIIAL